MAQNELKVLLLEDNPGDAFLIKFYLDESTSPKFNVTHAETLKAALNMLAENKFDIIISDMNVPDSFGVDTIKSILSDYPGNMLIVLTGLTDEEVGLETVRFGAQDFLVKGKFDGKVLISSLMFAFERFKLNRQIAEENTRLDIIQRLAKVGFYEVDTLTGKLFITDLTLSITQAENTDKSLSLQDRCALLEDSKELLALIEKSKTEPLSGEIIIKRKSDGKAFQLTYESKGNKFYGIMKICAV